MARKQRTRKRTTKPRRPAPRTTPDTTMSSDEQPPGPHSGRQSSVGTLSDPGTSEGAHTSMTSVHTTDDEAMAEDDAAAHSSDYADVDLHSIYPASHYPHVASSHRTEMPYLTAGSFTANSDLATSTQSLWAQDLDYREIHGRLYCRDWFMPIDDIEQLRSSLNHQIFSHVLRGEHSSIQLDKPVNILDVGTGTGEWAIRMAEMYPDCDVVGTDIAAVAETKSVPMNVFFEIEDAEDWDRSPDFYDLIHFRTMDGAFRDWRFVFDNVFYSLKPGGWVELQEFDCGRDVGGFIDLFSPDSPIHTLLADLDAAAEKSGRSRGNAHMDTDLLTEAGFLDARRTEYQIPLTVADKSAGKIWLISCLDSFEAMCLRPLTEHMGWSADKCKAACESAARELVELAKNPDTAADMTVKVRVVAARKPIDTPASDPGNPPSTATGDGAASTPTATIRPSCSHSPSPSPVPTSHGQDPPS